MGSDVPDFDLLGCQVETKMDAAAVAEAGVLLEKLSWTEMGSKPARLPETGWFVTERLSRVTLVFHRSSEPNRCA